MTPHTRRRLARRRKYTDRLRRRGRTRQPEERRAHRLVHRRAKVSPEAPDLLVVVREERREADALHAATEARQRADAAEVAEATRLPLKYVLDALPSYKLQWHCECVGKWRCHEDIAVQAATGPPMLHQPHPPTEFTKEWMWLVVKGKLAGEAILELGLR